jgi:hypothetical protein
VLRARNEKGGSSKKEKKMTTLNQVNMGDEGLCCRLKLARRLTVRLPEHLAKALTNIAKREGVMPSELVRVLVVEALRARADVKFLQAEGASDVR